MRESLLTCGESPSVHCLKHNWLDGISFCLLALEHNFSRPSHNLTYVLELTICWISCDGGTCFIRQNLLSPISFLSCFPTHSATLDWPIGCKLTSSINDAHQSSSQVIACGLCLRAIGSTFEMVYELCTLHGTQTGSIVFHCKRLNIYCQLLTGHVFTHAVLVKHL